VQIIAPDGSKAPEIPEAALLADRLPTVYQNFSHNLRKNLIGSGYLPDDVIFFIAGNASKSVNPIARCWRQ
jgi:hypothetical protein